MMQSFDVTLRQRSAGGFNYDVNAAKMVHRLHNIVNRKIVWQISNRFCLENPTGLFMGEATSFNMVGIIGEVNLKTMVEPA